MRVLPLTAFLRLPDKGSLQQSHRAAEGQLLRRISYFNIRANFLSLNLTGSPYGGVRQLAKRYNQFVCRHYIKKLLRSYKKDIRKLSVKEILEQSSDPSSDFREWSKKLALRKPFIDKGNNLSKKTREIIVCL